MTTAPPQTPQTSQIHMVDLFAGPGGLDVAAHWLGLAVDGVEWDADACQTREAAGFRTRQGDVRESSAADFPDATILAGGPPCQTYTLTGNGDGRRALELVKAFAKRMATGEDVSAGLANLGDDYRTGLVLQPLKWALHAAELGHPYNTIVLEQVPGVLPVWETIEEALGGLGLGYRTVSGVLHTEDYGVPQTRRRAILIARRDGEAKLPKPTHHRFRLGAPRPADGNGRKTWVTMGEALGRKDEFKVVSNYSTGGNTERRGRRTSDQPSFTITGKWTRNRLVTPDAKERDLGRFTEGEAGRLQTFPMDFPWDGKARAQQIGNAIPPRLAAHVLAAALGWELDEAALDAAVDSPWETTKGSSPLKPAPAE
ncbi:DNA cytosine methyltransferase [Streptacidiphilus pinicola]|uniref:DNA (cytosine-5-)-methyltransferase n=1 Tax=Streptacidiphilus pinicola TaxID=2219663 RepID=A0A2X0K3F6_9ACTN|nr:DNA cytosine methyltransferase [Streptacidiphilus pinicola]RAG83795.1 DNA cytosine methyltransferase [Streptacidiphilus pinicola]